MRVIIVDTNIVFSALLSVDSAIRRIITGSQECRFFTSNYMRIELENHYSKLVALALYLDAYLWTGDKILYNGLKTKGFKKVISTQELKLTVNG